MKFCRVDGAALVSLADAPTEILGSRVAPRQSASSLETNVLSEPSQTISRPRTTGDLKPETRYARSGDINIAYQVLGDGLVPLAPHV